MVNNDLMCRRKLNVLILYSAYTVRSNLVDSLYSFRRHTSHRIYYFNVAFRGLPAFMAKIDWDLIVFHTLFFARKFEREKQVEIFRKVMALSENPALKVLTPQDEFINSDIVCEFASSIGANTICSVQPSHVWPKIYGSLNEIEIRGILTGYIDPLRVKACSNYFLSSHQRTIDVGYRTIGKPVPWFGRHGFLKEKVAERFSAALSKTDLNYDISTDDNDALVGEDWYAFLGKCKYVLGVEGGTSILDYNGSVKEKVDSYLSKNPLASFDDLESNCFPGIDGEFDGFAISPRHLEACFTGTCQVLTEGDYSGILIPYRHYIPVKKDFSNIDQVLSNMRDDNLRLSIVDNSYRDIVQSGLYSIDSFAKAVIGPIEAYCVKRRGRIRILNMLLIYAALYIIDAADRVVSRMRAHYLSYIK